MEREEIEAMWERIKALEENSLRICKTLGEDSIARFYLLKGTILMLEKGNLGAYKEYMDARAREAGQQINDAQNVHEVIQAVNKFTDDYIKFTTSLLK
jgi:hypothetical protein